MTLEELQAEFPHGSRWRYKPTLGYFELLNTLETGDLRPPFTVFGWHFHTSAAAPHVGLIDDDGVDGIWLVTTLRDRLERIPDPVPCPITEPLTLAGWRAGAWGHSHYVCADARHSTPPGVPRHNPDYLPAITLIPDGRGGIEVKWEGGPE